MKNVILASLCFILLNSCVSNTKGFDAYFCRSNNSPEKAYLYIDKNKIGLLPYVYEMPSPEEVSLSSGLLYTGLRSGSHTVQVKNEAGSLLFSAKLKAKRKFNSSTINTSIQNKQWTARAQAKDESLVMQLVY